MPWTTVYTKGNISSPILPFGVSGETPVTNTFKINYNVDFEQPYTEHFSSFLSEKYKFSDESAYNIDRWQHWKLADARGDDQNAGVAHRRLNAGKLTGQLNWNYNNL